MRLRNKKTGEIVIFGEGIVDLNQIGCKNVAEMIEEGWEDYEEECKQYWYLEYNAEILSTMDEGSSFDKWMKQIGNYFETKEEAEKAVEKLKALKRLEDRGVALHSFEGYEDCDNRYRIIFSVRCDRYWSDRAHSVDADLNLLFGGEEEDE